MDLIRVLIIWLLRMYTGRPSNPVYIRNMEYELGLRHRSGALIRSEAFWTTSTFATQYFGGIVSYWIEETSRRG